MKKFAAITAVALLAACGGTEEAEEPAGETTTMTSAPGPGLYEVAQADGEVAQTRLNADGTYADIVDGEQVATGAYEWNDGEMCFTAEGSEESACFKDSPVAEDGSFTVTAADGTTSTVRRVGD